MLVLGIICLVVGFVVPSLGVLRVIGAVLIAVAILLILLGAVGATGTYGYY